MDSRRFTPTCVGNMKPPVKKVTNMRFTPTCVGNIKRSVWSVPIVRFTPTCVGNIPIACIQRLTTSVHPHVCGEYVSTISQGVFSAVHPHVCGEYNKSLKTKKRLIGSPPRVWGIYTGRGVEFADLRFTPTCVGNMIVAIWINGLMNGSPPRVWGISLTKIIGGRNAPVHPHVCGEYGGI